MSNNEEETRPTLEPGPAKPQRTLWMLDCSNGNYHQLIPLYALSEEDANELAEKYIRESEKRIKDGVYSSRRRIDRPPRRL